jgi:hypothetical protein
MKTVLYAHTGHLLQSLKRDAQHKTDINFNLN